MNTYTQCMNQIHEKLLRNGGKFDTVAPAPFAVDGVYGIGIGLDWTESFYVGMLWLDWMRTKDENIKKNIDLQMIEAETRLKQERGLGHHDIGFLYTLSAVAGYKLTGEEKYKEMGIRAARLLSKRYHPSAEFIQAWGDPNGKENYRLIIDCMLNIPLLYWAAEASGDRSLYDIAYHHAKTTKKVIFREDFSTYHTYYFDYENGKPLYGKTKQGAGDDTAWARGQAWAIYGFALSYRYTNDEAFLEAAEKAADYFLAHLPKDGVCYWDLCFGDGDKEPRDTSAAAIAVCGMLELDALSGENTYRETAERILRSLCENYCSSEEKESILDHGTYSVPDHVGIDEACIWGDYYFYEALCRVTEKNLKLFW